MRVLLALSLALAVAAPALGQDQPPPFVQEVLRQLTKPLALVKHTVGQLTTSPVQVVGPNAHRVALIFINPTNASIATAGYPITPEIDVRSSFTVPPTRGQTAVMDASVREAWSAVADRNADAGLTVWEVVR